MTQFSSSTNEFTLSITRIHQGFDDIPLPDYATEHSAGVDLRAAVSTPVVLKPGDIEAIPTNLAIELPSFLEAQIRPRSGLALKHGITLPNTPGTIDADYRGEIKVIMVNLGKEPFRIERGDRIAQLVVSPVVHVQWKEVSALESTDRGAGGFGHSGLK